MRPTPQRRQASESAFRLELTKLRSNDSELRVVVSTKIAKKAVDRNKLKRRLREIWRALPHEKGARVTVYTRREALNLDFASLSAQFASAIKKL